MTIEASALTHAEYYRLNGMLSRERIESLLNQEDYVHQERDELEDQVNSLQSQVDALQEELNALQGELDGLRD